MAKNRQKPCSVFTEEELRELRRVPWGMKIVIGLFVAIVVLIFVPFQTVTQLGHQVGILTAVQTERRALYEKQLEMQQQRLEKVEAAHAAFQKKFYWINRHSREANEKIEKVLLRLERFGSNSGSIEISRSAAGLPSKRR